MAKSLLLLPILGLILPVSLIFSGGGLSPVIGQAAGQGAWCTPRPSSSDQELMENINFACRVVNCSIIQPEGPCFYPSSLMNHASVVMNLYYQKLGRNFWNCDFNKSGLVVVTDPSYGNCEYEYAE